MELKHSKYTSTRKNKEERRENLPGSEEEQRRKMEPMERGASLLSTPYRPPLRRHLPFGQRLADQVLSAIYSPIGRCCRSRATPTALSARGARHHACNRLSDSRYVLIG
jgi:hypothetical protein